MYVCLIYTFSVVLTFAYKFIVVAFSLIVCNQNCCKPIRFNSKRYTFVFARVCMCVCNDIFHNVCVLYFFLFVGLDSIRKCTKRQINSRHENIRFNFQRAFPHNKQFSLYKFTHLNGIHTHTLKVITYTYTYNVDMHWNVISFEYAWCFCCGLVNVIY